MDEIITVNSEDQTISARELHERLNIKTPFTMWFDRMIEYGFSEGVEFFTKMLETSEIGGRPAKDYDITVDMAKEICMIQRTHKAHTFCFLKLRKGFRLIGQKS